MSNLGIGLGGFMQGFERGQQIRDDRADRERKKVIEQRQDQEYQRALDQRTAIDQVNKDASGEFNKRVAAGTEQAGDFDHFWTNYALPKLTQQYLLNGDVDTAHKLKDWGEKEETKAGAKLAAGAILKAQTGDISGALDDAIAAGQKQGYISHGYEVLGKEQILDPSGKPAGYRLKLKTPDGKEVDQDIQNADAPRLIATFLNPQAAFESQQAAAKEKAKDAEELKQYGAKKSIDQQYGTGVDKVRSDAITTLRKRMDGGLDGTETKFDDLPAEQQEKLISSETALQKGQPGLSGVAAPAMPGAAIGVPSASATPMAGAATPQRKILVDTATGQPVTAPMAAPPVQPAGPAPAPAQQPAPASQGDNVSYLLQSADQAIQQGENPDRIAAELRNSGVAEDQWPGSLRTALARRQQSQSPFAVGLGGG